MMINLITNMSELITRYERQVLEKASDGMAEKYRHSRKATDAIAKKILQSETMNQTAENNKLSHLRLYSLLIHEAEDLEILMKINEATKAIQTDLIKNQVDKVVHFLKNEVQITNYGSYIFENLKNKENVYCDFLSNLAQEIPDTFFNHISFFLSDCKVTKKDIALEIAKRRKGAEGLAKNIELFSMTKEADRKEIALAIAKHKWGAVSLARRIDKFCLTDQESLKKIALAIAKTDVGAECLAENINRFFLDNESDLKQLALKIAEHKFGAVSLAENIKKFCFSDKASLKQIALAIARHNEGAESLAENIHHFAIEREEKKEIALAIAGHERGAASLAKNIKAFSLTTGADKKEIAIAIAQHNEGAQGLARHFEKFAIENETDRKNIALAIAKFPFGAVNLTHNIEKFSVANEEARKQIALAIAAHEKGAESLAQNIEKFSIVSEEDRKEIALAILQHRFGPQSLIENNNKFRIEDRDFERQVVSLAFRWPSSLLSLKAYLHESEIVKHDCSYDAIRECPSRPYFNETSDVNKKRQFMFRSLELSGVKLEEVKERIEERVKPLSDHFPANSELETIKNTYRMNPSDRPSRKEYEAACKQLRKMVKTQKVEKTYSRLISDLEKEEAFWAPIYDCVEGILKIDGDLQYDLTHWMIYSLFLLLQTKEKRKAGPPFESQLLKKIYNIRDGELRYHLASLFAEQMSRTDWNKMITPSYAFMTKILLNDLKQSHPEIDTKAFTQTLTLRKQFFYDGEKQAILYKALWGLKKSESVTADQINHILEHFSRKTPSDGDKKPSLALNDKTFLLELRALNALISLKKEASISFDTRNPNKKQLTDNLSQAFGQLLPGLNISNSTRFSERFFGERQPAALAIYVAGLLRLPAFESETVLKIVKTFVEEVDGGSFLTSRYQDSDHLNRIAEGDPNIFEMWKTGKQGPLADYLEGNSDPDVVEAMINSLKTKIVTDRRLPIERLPLVAQASGEEVDSSEPFKALDTLLSNLIQNPDLLTADYLDKILIELKTLPKDDVLAFTQDVESFKEELKPKAPKKIEKWQIVDSDDPLDLFLSGTEVGGSCQSVDRDPGLNKALMGYVMDGKHRILAVKDSQGKIVERLILRLLLDEETNEPVLFFECIYPETAKYGDALKKFAKVRAKELGVPLVSKETPAETKYKGSLVSYSSKAPCEYCDAAGGIQTGAFKITDCYEIAP